MALRRMSSISRRGAIADIHRRAAIGRRNTLSERATSQTMSQLWRDVNKLLLAYVILFKRTYFRQYFVSVCKRLTNATYYCQIEVNVPDRIAEVISIIGHRWAPFSPLTSYYDTISRQCGEWLQ